MIKGKIHIDHVLNFGASPSPRIFGRVTEAAVQIFLSRDVDVVIKWVDDFVFFCYPTGPKQGSDYDFNYSSTLIWNVAAELGWPWAPVKFVDFSNIFMYIGFQWDFSRKEVTLPAQKKIKYLAKLSTWILGSHIH